MVNNVDSNLCLLKSRPCLWRQLHLCEFWMKVDYMETRKKPLDCSTHKKRPFSFIIQKTLPSLHLSKFESLVKVFLYFINSPLPPIFPPLTSFGHKLNPTSPLSTSSILKLWGSHQDWSMQKKRETSQWEPCTMEGNRSSNFVCKGRAFHSGRLKMSHL